MAVDTTSSVDHIEKLLTSMGYKLGPGHKPGQMDDAFLQAYEIALKDLIRIGSEGSASTYAEGRTLLIQKIEKNRNDADKMGALEAYSRGEGYNQFVPVYGKNHEELKQALAGEGLLDNLLVPENVKGVVEFFKHGDQYIADLDKIESARKQLAAAASSKAAPSSPLPTQPKAIPVSTTGTAAPGAIDPATAEDFRSQIQKLQMKAVGADGKKWGGGKFGVFTPGFHDFIMKAPDKNPDAVKFFEDVKNQGISLKDLATETRRAHQVKNGTTVPEPQTGQPVTGQPTAQPAAPLVTPSVTQPVTPDTQPAGDGSSKPASAEVVRQASDMVDRALAKLGETINDQMGERKKDAGMLTGFLFKFNDIPVLSGSKTKDGVFDRDSRESLQAVLKVFQSDIGLTDDEVYNYTPEVGKKIVKAYPRLKERMSKEQQKEFPKEYFEGLANALNILKDSGQLAGGRVYTDSPIKVTGLGAQILQWIFDFVGKAFPGMRGFMDTLLARFTGGFTYNDLMPEDKKDRVLSRDLAQIRKDVAHLTPEQQLEKQYLDAWKDAKKNGREAEFKSVIAGSVEKMVGLAPGDGEAQTAFRSAIDKAMADAEKKGNAQEAAKSFASTFAREWRGPGVVTKALATPLPASAPKPAPPQAETSSGQGTTSPAPVVKEEVGAKGVTSPAAIPARGTAMSVDASVSGLPEGGALMDRFMKDTGKPLFFHRGNDPTLYVMGVSADNRLVAEKISADDILALRKGETAGRPALQLLAGERYKNYSPDQISEMMQEKNVVNFHAVDLKAAPQADQPRHADPDRPQRVSDPLPGAPNFVAQNREAGDMLLSRYTALSRPTMQVGDFTNLGKIYVVYCNDRNGFYAERDTRYNEGDKRAVEHALAGEGNPYFAMADITNDVARYLKGYKQFCDDRSKALAGMSEHQKFAKYAQYLQDPALGKGLDLAKEYPDMAAVIRNPKTGKIYYPEMVSFDMATSADKIDIPKFAEYMHGQLNRGNAAKFNRDYGLSTQSGFTTERPRVSNPVQQFTNDIGDAGNSLLRGIKNLFNGKASDEPRPDWSRGGQRAYNFHLPDYNAQAQNEFPAAQGVAAALEQEQKAMEREEQTPAAQYGENGKDISARPGADSPVVDPVSRPVYSGARP